MHKASTCTWIKKLAFLCLIMIICFQNVYAQTGQTLQFNGSSNYVGLPFGISGNYTKEAWINAASISGFPNIITGNSTAFYLDNGKLTAGHAGVFAYKEVQDPATLSPNTWYHIAVTYDAAASEMKLYKDGVLIATNSGASSYTENLLNLSFFAGGNYFNGQMDEVRIWKTVRTATEINQSKDCELTGDEPGLLAYYNFNQGVAGGNNTGITMLTDSQDKCTALNGVLNNFTMTGAVSNFIGAGPALSGTCSNSFPNINVTGNNLCIESGDVTPSAADFTHFGNFTTAPVTRTFIIQNTGNVPLTINSINFSGANATDFSVTSSPASPIAGGSASGFAISFNPAGALGTKTATVTISSDDADELTYTFTVEGIKSAQGKSLDFDGANDDISLPFVISGDYTKEAWIKTNTQSNFPNILSGTGTALFLNNGRLAAGHAGSFDQALHSTVLATNQWYHVAVTYNATTQVMKLYLNGNPVVTASSVPVYTESNMRIGSFGNNNFFWGKIDQVRVWNVARTDAEILNSAECNISGDEPGLLAWYNFNQGAGEGDNTGLSTLPNDVDDCNAAAKNGTLNNFALTGTTSNWVSESNNITIDCSATFPNIQVEGNNICIATGDNSPATADNTDFGNASGAGTDKTFVIRNTGTAALTIGSINFSGIDASMFSVTTPPASTIAAGMSSNMLIHFAPVGLGVKTAGITINNNDADEAAYTFALQGTGIASSGINISNIIATPDVNGTATITWTTDVAGTSSVDYGTDPNVLTLNNNNATLVTSHSIVLTGLTLGENYYFRVTSVDASSNTATSPVLPAAPLAFSMPANITVQPASQAICEGQSVTFTSTATSDSTLTVQWQISVDNGGTWQDSTGATSGSISFTASDADNGKQFRAVWTTPGGNNYSAAAILTVNDTSWGVENIAVCRNNLPFSWNGNEYTETGSYNIVLPAANQYGCDSTAVLNLTVKDTSFSITNVEVCRNLLPYSWNGNDYTETGSYTVVLPAANINGCDSTATLNLIVKDTSFSITNVEVCRNLLPYTWNGNDYTETGSYTIVLPAANINGCDSTATLNLTVKDTSFSITNVEVCRNLLPYTWNGNDYTETGSYTIVLPAANINGCDSTATLNLTVKDTSFSITNVEVCRNLLPYTWNGNDYTETGSYTIVLPAANINGCDSTATLNLTVKDTSFSITNVEVCRNLLPYSWNGNDYTETGSYTIVLPAANINGCDSTATLNLTVKDTSFSITNVEVCRNLLPYTWNGNDYTETGSYTVVLPAANINGCDSTATLNLTVKDTSFSITNVEVCRNLLPYSWNGNDYTETGSYTIVLPAANINGCDSTATLNLTIKDTSFSVTDITVCHSDLPYSWNGTDYTEAGSYTIVLPSANMNGCDSTATLNLTVTVISGTIVKQFISCIGESDGSLTVTASGGAGSYEYSIDNGATWNSTGLFENLAAGSYSIRMKDANGCYNDSTVTVDIDKAYWTGALSSDWHTAGNWSTGVVPSSSTHVIIPGTAPLCIISNSDAEAASVQVFTGAELRTENNRELMIAGKCASLPVN
ncbi:MAG: choice-of-anchor D domain-containing protein [Ferruginibacter sp.]